MEDVQRAPVILSDYDPEWQLKFEDEKAHLVSIIGPWHHGTIEHIGSTAVPGMVAKPVIDVMFGVKSLDESRPAIQVMQKNGYEYSPYKGDIMHWFCKPSDAFRTHHIHLVPYQSELWSERIRFRDVLLSNQEIAEEYCSLKRALADRYKYNREAYTLEKWPFIKQVLQLENDC